MIETQDLIRQLTTTKKLARAIRYLADSDACTRVQFRRDPLQCFRHSEGTDGCEDCWREELGRESET